MSTKKDFSAHDFKQRVDLLSNIAERILTNENLSDTTYSIMETLRSHLKAFGGGVFSFDENNNLFLLAYTETKFIDKAVKAISGDLARFKFPINNKKVLLSKCVKEKIIIKSKTLSDFFAPIVSKKAQDFIQKVTGLKMCIGIPIIIKNEARGVLFANFRKEKLSQTEISLLKFYANLSGLAIENSHKLQELENKYELEKETTSMLSHELKTPIAIAYSSAQTLKTLLKKHGADIGPLLSKFEKTQEDIQKGIMRMNDICNSVFNLMEIEHRDARQIHKLDLERQLEQVLKNYERKANSKNLKFSANLKIKDENLFGGGVQLEQVLCALLDNAVKYTNKGEIQLNIKSEKNKILCEIIDTGPGIPKSKQKKIFERYYRNKTLSNKYLRNINGLGLGLYIANKIIRNLEGDIRVAKNPHGKGTKFIVEIPAYKVKQ